MWRGGSVPFGYAVHGRSLTEHPTDGALLRIIFQRYLDCGNLGILQRWLGQDPRFVRDQRGPDGRVSTGALRYLLSNRIYVGEICSKGACSAGQHSALVAPEQFDKCQELLKAGSVRYRQRSSQSPHFPLAGLVSDETGKRARVTRTGKSERHHRYYVIPSHDGHRARRVPAAALESAVRTAMNSLTDWLGARSLEMPSSRIAAVAESVIVSDDSIVVTMKAPVLATIHCLGLRADSDEATIDVGSGCRLVLSARSAVLKKQWIAQGYPRLKTLSGPGQRLVDQPLGECFELARAHHLLNEILSGNSNFGAVCNAEHLSDRALFAVLEPAFRSPSDVRALVTS